MKGKNDEFDARVLKVLSRAVHLRFSDIEEKLSGLAGVAYSTREIDRALQRLRKAGKVKFVARHGWIRVQPGS